MRRLLLALALFAVAIPAQARECANVEIARHEDNPIQIAADTDADIRASIVGDFLWVQYDHEIADSENDIISYPIPADAVHADVCRDGVTFTAEPTPVKTSEYLTVSPEFLAVLSSVPFVK